MPPYCKLHDTFHTTKECEFEKARAARARLAAIKERQAAERQKRAERIAADTAEYYRRQVARSFYRPDFFRDKLSPEVVQLIEDAATAAALGALTEMENQK